MVERGRTITPETPAETVHDLRKDAKKLRYLIECFGGLYDKPSRTAFVGRLKALQDTLGEHQDAEVHAHALRTIADDRQRHWDAETLLAIGQLIERLEQRRLATRKDLAERFAAFDDKETAQALKDAAGERQGRFVKALATYSIKGGVGKTTTAVNLSFEAASSGARVLLWDLDPQGAATFFFRVKPRVKGGVRRLLGSDGELAANVKESDVAGLHLVPADFSLRHLDVHLADGTGSTASLAALLEAAGRRLRRRRSSTAPPASRWAARRCSEPLTHCSSRRSRRRCRCARSTSSPRSSTVPTRRRRTSGRSCRCSTAARRCTAS